MDSNINSEEFVANDSFDNYQSFQSNPSARQDMNPRFRGQGHYQGTISFD